MLLPLRFNDGSDVPEEWLVESTLEVVERFGAASHETQKVEGRWRHGGVLYRDELVRIVVDVDDMPENREWVRGFRARWNAKLEHFELWVVSYQLDVE